jgi:putative selenate reductase
MSGIMRPIPFLQLINRIQGEFKNTGSVFGIRKEKFFRPSSCNFDFFGEKTSVPIGVSAGPHTQLAQNILSCFLAGARHINLKTVQTMDGEELRKAIAKPSINAVEEGYNVEWSTELTVLQAMEEYIKAWFLCHIFAVEFEISEKADVIFSTSAGYSLEAIRSEKIDSFIEGMKDAKNTAIWQNCYEQTASVMSSFNHFTKADLEAISPNISNKIIVSTFYNCPKDETEKIVIYFLGQKNLHTYIKCNPTLLGYETCRSILDDMGYDHITFTDHFFKTDLQFNDAVKLLRHMKALAAKIQLGFGVKLTNTLPVDINRNELPGSRMYLSGRALFPLTLHTVKKITEAFHGEMPISFSGGADFFNYREILETGIRPVTMVTNLLKTGGIEKLNQLAIASENIEPVKGINIKALNSLCDSKQERYKKINRRTGKVFSKLPVFDCAKAPCVCGCPLHIKIPDFLSLAADEQYGEAFKILVNDNPAPSITANICDRECQKNCTRFDYEDPLQTGNIELLTVKNAQDDYIQSITASQINVRKPAAVIGAGPAGIASAVFLRRNGVAVTVYEKGELPFGAIQNLVPSFDIPTEAILRDYQIAVKTGVEFIFNVPHNFSISELKKKHRFIVIATGALKAADVDTEQFSGNQLRLDGKLPFTNNNMESSIPDVYVAGSCRTGSLKTVNAIVDGKIAAFDILKKLKITADFSIDVCESHIKTEINLQNKGIICTAKDDNTEAQRCLSCNIVCENCVDVCPNRANISVTADGKNQIIHIDNMCNSCGNCASFCPYDGRPYADKLTIFTIKEDFDESKNMGFLKTGKTFMVRLENQTTAEYSQGGENIPAEWASLLKTLSNKYGYLF